MCKKFKINYKTRHCFYNFTITKKLHKTDFYAITAKINYFRNFNLQYLVSTNVANVI